MKVSDYLKRRWPSLFVLAGLFFLLALVIYLPLLEMLKESLRENGRWSFANFGRFFDFNHPAYLRALWGSVAISALTVIGSALVGVPLAILFSRFHFPGRKTFGVLVTLPVLLPPLVGVIAFYFLMGETGIVPRVLQKLLGLKSAPLVMSGVPAILLVHVYSFYVFFYLFSRNALASLDRSLEEAASGLGASRFMLWQRVILPQLKPALLGASMLVFMNSMASFTAPYMFGGNWRFLSLEIYNAKLNGDLALAITQAAVLAGISVLFLFLLRWYGRDHPAGRGSKGVAMPPRYVTKPWQKILLAVSGGALIFLLILPQLTLVLIAFVKNGTWTWQVLPEQFTLENFFALFTSSNVAQPWLNSLWMSAAATAFGVLVALPAAFFAARQRQGLALGHVLDASVMLPWAVPGTVIAVALIILFDEPHWFTAGQVLIGSAAILPLAYFIRHLPIQFRALVAAFAQMDPGLEEAAQNLGANWWLRFRRITLPLILPGLVTGGMMAFVIALGEFVSSILLYTFSNRPLSIAIFSEIRLFNLGSAAAYSVLLIIFIGMVMWLSQKWAGGQSESLSN
jgi:iron(III) transport system permease protein